MSQLCMRWPKYWSFSFSIIPSRADLLQNGLVGSPCSPRDSQEASPAPQFKSINSSALCLLYGSALTTVHDYWKLQCYSLKLNQRRVGEKVSLLIRIWEAMRNCLITASHRDRDRNGRWPEKLVKILFCSGRITRWSAKTQISYSSRLCLHGLYIGQTNRYE